MFWLDRGLHISSFYIQNSRDICTLGTLDWSILAKLLDYRIKHATNICIRVLNKSAELNSTHKQAFFPYLLFGQHCSPSSDCSEQINRAKAKFLFLDSRYIVVYLTITESMMKSWKQVVQYTNLSIKEAYIIITMWCLRIIFLISNLNLTYLF